MSDDLIEDSDYLIYLARVSALPYDACKRLDEIAARIAELTARAEKAEALLDRAVEALRDTASQALSTEIQEGHGPEITDDPEFHRGFDAAVMRIRATLAAIREAQNGRA